MFENKKILAIIPARGGSKGIKGKNIIPLMGKPLIAYTIEASLKSNYIDSTIVTTDNQEIAVVAKQHGARVPFLRPAELAKDTSKTLDAILHAVEKLSELGESYDVLILLQPTQPLRSSEDIDNAIELFFEKGRKDLVSVSSVEENPLLVRAIEKNGRMSKLLDISSTCRRQEMPNYYKVNGCIYINNISELNENTSFNDNSIPFIMSKEHSVDIDEPADLALAEFYIKEGKGHAF